MQNPPIYFALNSWVPVATESQEKINILPPPYAELQRLHPSTEILPNSEVHALKRCLIWRIAVDWKLKWDVPRIDRPSDREYSRFESCCEDYGKLLGEKSPSQKSCYEVNRRLFFFIFLPGTQLGITCDLLELFMFSVRRTKKRSGFFARRYRRIINRRDEVQLLRLVLDSRILINLITNPHTAFAEKVKTKCNRIHKTNFSWLLDPALINTDDILRVREASIHSWDTQTGHWKQAMLLMDECRRPSTALMEPSLSRLYRADLNYFLQGMNIRQQPGFMKSIERAYVHRDRLPSHVTFGVFVWRNQDYREGGSSELMDGKPEEETCKTSCDDTIGKPDVSEEIQERGLPPH